MFIKLTKPKRITIQSIEIYSFDTFRSIVDESEEVIQYVDIEAIKNGSTTTAPTNHGIDKSSPTAIITRSQLSTKASSSKTYEIK